MGDAQHSRTGKLLIDQLLDGLLGDDINVGSSFVQDHDLVAP
jgi:hypothetical protein